VAVVISVVGLEVVAVDVREDICNSMVAAEADCEAHGLAAAVAVGRHFAVVDEGVIVDPGQSDTVADTAGTAVAADSPVGL
jgi:hypothetical protein